MFDRDVKTKGSDRGVVPAHTNTSEADGGTRIVEGASSIDLARVGLNEIAYIKQAVVNDEEVWAIFSASGDPIGAAQSFDQAWGAVRQHDMEPARVH